MSEESKARQATPHADLIQQILDSRVAKNEREHAAGREIAQLRAALLPFAALLQPCHANMSDDRPVFGIGDSTITAGQMRAAVAVLKGCK